VTIGVVKCAVHSWHWNIPIQIDTPISPPLVIPHLQQYIKVWKYFVNTLCNRWLFQPSMMPSWRNLVRNKNRTVKRPPHPPTEMKFSPIMQMYLGYAYRWRNKKKENWTETLKNGYQEIKSPAATAIDGVPEILRHVCEACTKTLLPGLSCPSELR
jgi:hypothetical protein